MNRRTTCLLCPCLRYARGLCQRCYKAAKQRVDAGETTWDQLEAAGRAMPPARKESNALVHLFKRR